MRQLLRIAKNQTDIAHEGFYHGSQGCPPEEALAEIENKFRQQMEMVAHKATPQIKQLEATIVDVRRQLPAAVERLRSITARHGGRLPEIVVPSFMVLMGIFAMFAESGMLAPFMDMFDITNPVWQRLSALAIGSACAVILHLCIESLTPGRFELNKQRLLRALGIFCLIGLSWAGVVRGKQAAYGASLSGSPLAGFLDGNPFLAIIVYTFFTVAFPVAAAVAISFGVKAAREWTELLIAKREAAHLNTIVAKAPKELEGEQKKLSHELNNLEATRKEWQKSYLVQHQRGTAIGAAQTPKWMVWVKAGCVALVALLLSLPFIALPIVQIVVSMMAFLGAWAYFHKAWAHPKPHQLYNQQNVEFRNPNKFRRSAMKKLFACFLALAILLSGCDHTADVPREVTIVPDVSASIDPEAERQMFAAIADVSQSLHRGDSLTIIPITGDADAELQGRTLHYSIPAVENREAYDADLSKLRTQIKADLAKLQADVVAHPGKHTDILGTIRIALKGFSTGATDKRLVVLSDFMQDDEQFNFRRDHRLANEADAAVLGETVALPEGDYPKVNVLLGRLRSAEFSELPPSRQRAINKFWSQMMSPATVEADGTASVLRVGGPR